MRLHLSAFVALLALTPLARADTYQFDFTGEEASCDLDNSCMAETLQFELPSTPASYTSDTIKYGNIALTYNGFPFDVFDATVSGGAAGNMTFQTEGILFQNGGTGDNDIYFDLLQGSFTSGPNSSPSILPGSYESSFYKPDYFDLYGTTTITDLSSPPTTVTPEPSTLALLGSGALGTAGLFRRRILAR